MGKRVLALASDLRLLGLEGNLAEHDVCCPLVWEDPAGYLPPSQGRQQPSWAATCARVLLGPWLSLMR